MSSSQNLSKEELKLRLAELEAEYDLARTGLVKGGFAAGGALFGGLVTLGASLFAFVAVGPGFLSGNQLVIIYGMMIFALVIYFSFVFGRAAKLRVEITKTKKMLEMASAENVRK